MIGNREEPENRKQTQSRRRRMELQQAVELSKRVQNEIKKSVKGKDDCIRKAFCAILAGGHILIEDVPGVGKTTLALAEAHPFMYAAVGVHPNETAELTDADMKWLESLAENPKVVAIGEIGLDYYWDEPEREIQKHWFSAQLEVAKKTGLPVIIHSRDAAKDTLDIMKVEHNGATGGVIHCFSYGVEMAREYLNMGYYIGIGGVLTFKNAKKLIEVAEYAPLDRIVLETDCPYLAPVPNRGKRNFSGNLPYVVEKLAEIKGVSAEEIIRETTKNAREMHRITE